MATGEVRGLESRFVAVVVAVGIAVLATAIAIPPADAKPVCFEWEPWCPPGYLACAFVKGQVVCVYDPCYTTACW